MILPSRTIPFLHGLRGENTAFIIVGCQFIIDPGSANPVLVEDFGDFLIEVKSNNLLLIVLPCTALHVLHEEFDGVTTASVSVEFVGGPIGAIPVPIENGGHITVIIVDLSLIIHPISVIPFLVNDLAQ